MSTPTVVSTGIVSELSQLTMEIDVCLSPRYGIGYGYSALTSDLCHRRTDQVSATDLLSSSSSISDLSGILQEVFH